ncbi:MAG: cysteine hydrolase [Ramlibacter sp.]|nr:cysteine hydrolase [Cryobacterium sp.]
MARGVLVIDIQQDYFPGGAYPLVGSPEAALVAEAVVADARSRGEWVGHIRHASEAEAGGFLIAGTPGAEIHPRVRPLGSEVVLTKAEPNSFVGTGLDGILQGAGIDRLVVVGMMTSMCVDATVRAALDTGRTVSVVENGCAAPDLEFGGETIGGRTVHHAFAAALRDAGADVVTWPLAEQSA